MPPSLDNLVIPAIWTPDKSQDNWEEELDLAVESSIALNALATGQIEPDAYLDWIVELGLDPYELVGLLDVKS